MANVVGTAGDDVLAGDSADNIHGLGGNDTITAKRADTVFGDGGNDVINIVVDGVPGNQKVEGGAGNDIVNATALRCHQRSLCVRRRDRHLVVPES
jgi:Ca2+-binding RTX toxin-like protein